MLAGVLNQKCWCEPEKSNANELFIFEPRHSENVVPCHAENEVCLSGVDSLIALHKRTESFSAPLRDEINSEPRKGPIHVPNHFDAAQEELQRHLMRTQEALHREREETQKQNMRHRQLNSGVSHQGLFRELSVPTMNVASPRWVSPERSPRQEPESGHCQVVYRLGDMMLGCEPIVDPLFFLTIDYRSYTKIEALISRLASIAGDCVDFDATFKARQENQQVMLVRKHPWHMVPFIKVAGLIEPKMTLIGLITNEGVTGWVPPDSTRVQQSDELLVVAGNPYAFAAGLTKEDYLSEMPNGNSPYSDLKNRRCCL